MKNLLFIFLTVFALNTNGQTKVASYFIGKYGSTQYEHFSFTTDKGKAVNVVYAYGKLPKEIKLKYLGAKSEISGKFFTVRFPNGRELLIQAKGLNIQVYAADGTYSKTFAWEYEGPVNGIGTFCDVCAEDEKEAMAILKKGYFN